MRGWTRTGVHFAGKRSRLPWRRHRECCPRCRKAGSHCTACRPNAAGAAFAPHRHRRHPGRQVAHPIPAETSGAPRPIIAARANIFRPSTRFMTSNSVALPPPARAIPQASWTNERHQDPSSTPSRSCQEAQTARLQTGRRRRDPQRRASSPPRCSSR